MTYSSQFARSFSVFTVKIHIFAVHSVPDNPRQLATLPSISSCLMRGRNERRKERREKPRTEWKEGEKEKMNISLLGMLKTKERFLYWVFRGCLDQIMFLKPQSPLLGFNVSQYHNTSDWNFNTRFNILCKLVKALKLYIFMGAITPLLLIRLAKKVPTRE